MKYKTIFLILLISGFYKAESQNITAIETVKGTGLSVDKFIISDSSRIILLKNRPLFTFDLNDRNYNTASAAVMKNGEHYELTFGNSLIVTTSTGRTAQGIVITALFENKGIDTVSISNVVPFGDENCTAYITGKGPWDLARAWLFRPGYRPVRVILPDNAWELGYSSFAADQKISVCALARRTKVEGGEKQRYKTRLPAGAKVTYTIYAETFRGEWQNGLRLMFRDRYLHDLDKFDNSLFERSDLQWIKNSYLIVLYMAWDHDFYDRFTGKYNFPEIIRRGNEQFGNIDVFGIWPTWPRLGLDPRNQWDLYRDLPGGTTQLRNYARMSHQYNTRFFIAYNPWDNSTRKENHYKGMAGLIQETDADGVVLDTRGSSSYELQAAADSVKKGVIMYSEGMAVTRDMPGIISGRVHNAIYLSPELNLNKLIKPDFSIFRVCDVGEDLIHREIAIAFFNGYGTELNMMRPGRRDDDYRSDMDFLSKTTYILRQNNAAFLDNDWTPLIETATDDIYVNQWKTGNKTIYTVLSMKPEGIEGKLFMAPAEDGRHFVSLWNHENLKPVPEKDGLFIPARTESYNPACKGTRKEGAVDCIASFPKLIHSSLSGDSLRISKPARGKLFICKGNPSYQNLPRELNIKNDTIIRIKDLYGYFEGKIVLQLVENKDLRDENVIQFRAGRTLAINKIVKTGRSTSVPSDMVLVPGTRFSFKVSTDDDFMPYPQISGQAFQVDSFLIDRYPVTNAQYYDFVSESGYKPADTTRYLRHWVDGMFRPGQEKYPVVNLSYEDMQAYAKWAGKRLPSQAEWQLAAQGTDGRLWPWGNEFHGALCNNAFGRSTPVDAFTKGESQYGVVDMVGNVWQMMNDLYYNGNDYFGIIRGGSYYKPESSNWYIQGGPQPLNKTQILLLVSPAFDRSPTVGFRCARDIDSRYFRDKKKK